MLMMCDDYLILYRKPNPRQFKIAISSFLLMTAAELYMGRMRVLKHV